MHIDMYRFFFEIQQKHWWFTTKKKIVLDNIDRYFKPTSTPKILDVGCGSGLMLTALEGIGETYGMDMADEAIKFSKEIFDGTVKQGHLPDRVPYEDNFFDLITALDVIEHIEEDQKSLKTLHSRLKDGGVAVITVPAYMFLWTKFDDMNEHKRRYTLTEMRAKLIIAGFKIEKISYYNTLLFPIVLFVRILNKLRKNDGTSGLDVPSHAVNLILSKIFGFEKMLLKHMNFPFGVSVLAVVRK